MFAAGYSDAANGRVGSAKKTGKARQWPDDHFYEQLRDVGHGS